MADEKFIKSELRVRATASLQEEVDKDLKVKDPSPEKAKAVLEGEKKDNEVA